MADGPSPRSVTDASPFSNPSGQPSEPKLQPPQNRLFVLRSHCPHNVIPRKGSLRIFKNALDVVVQVPVERHTPGVRPLRRTGGGVKRKGRRIQRNLPKPRRQLKRPEARS